MATKRARRSHHRSVAHPLAAVFGAHVRRMREAKGFTFDAFAEELGRGYVSDLERGLVVPTLATLAKLASVLEIELIDVVAIGVTAREALVQATRDLTPAQLQRLLREAQGLSGESRAIAAETAHLALNPAPKRRK